MMQYEQGQFQAIEHAGLVEDLAQRVLNSVLGCTHVQRDLPVLATLHDKRDDAQVELRETLTHTKADRVLADFKLLIVTREP